MYSVRETADIYSKITKPKFIETLDKSHVDWMHNVLEGKKETELCLFENDHFKLQKDYKFNEGDLTTLYLLAMPKAAPTKHLYSIRDLTADHLPMLKSICEESYKVIQEKYAIPAHKIYAYFHYLPTYWLLHIHFVHVDKASRDARE
jgi:m7GpppX diphosphatase